MRFGTRRGFRARRGSMVARMKTSLVVLVLVLALTGLCAAQRSKRERGLMYWFHVVLVTWGAKGKVWNLGVAEWQEVLWVVQWVV